MCLALVCVEGGFSQIQSHIIMMCALWFIHMPTPTSSTDHVSVCHNITCEYPTDSHIYIKMCTCNVHVTQIILMCSNLAGYNYI